jgi:hypothetical protein
LGLRNGVCRGLIWCAIGRCCAAAGPDPADGV